MKLVFLVAAVAAAFAGSVLLLRGGAAETSGEITVLERLDEYTKKNPNLANTVPTFLLQLGKTGILARDAAPAPETPATPVAAAPPATPAAPPAAAPPPSPAPVSPAPSPGAVPSANSTTPPEPTAPATTEPAPPGIPVSAVRPLNETELKKGFCTATLTRLVRQQYPGQYDDIPDDELEKSVLKQRPNYKGRICVLPVWIDADPHDIIKYEVRQDVAAIPRIVFLWSALIAGAFGLVLVLAYKKATAEPPPPPPPPKPRQRLSVEKPM